MIPTNEISDMAWFLVHISKPTNIENLGSFNPYCVLHMADLTDTPPADVYINCSVKFMLCNKIWDGKIVNASNSIIDLILEAELKLLQNAMTIQGFLQQMLQRFPHTLKEIFRMSQCLMEKCKSIENTNRINHLLLQVRQLSQDTIEIHGVTQYLLQRLVYFNASDGIRNLPVSHEVQQRDLQHGITEAVER